MTDLLPELSALPVAATLDGELVAFGADGAPDFPLLCERMLMRQPGIAITCVLFDLISLDGRDLTGAPYSERRAELEGLNLNGVYSQTPEVSTMAWLYIRRGLRTRTRGRRYETPQQPLPAW